MNEIVKRSFRATPLIVRVAYKIFCIVYRPNKNLKKNAIGVVSDIYGVYEVLSDNKLKQNVQARDKLEETKDVTDFSSQSFICQNSSESLTNKEISSGSSTSNSQAEIDEIKVSQEEKTAFSVFAKWLLALFVVWSVYLCLTSNDPKEMTADKVEKEEIIVPSDPKDGLSVKDTVADKSVILLPETSTDTKKLSEEAEKKQEPVWLDGKEKASSILTSGATDKKEIDHKNLIREQIF